ncbi:MAG: Gfo/Idh/MocA family oxidoreductase [Lentisphaeraceae bacterium]|nr:Gfo/Idh/MocA family oxidoreductase [Lentisphaeraceae bacterium]
MDKVKWGILGAGVIAEKVASAIKEYPHAVLAGVGSRSIEKAEAFAERVCVEKAFGSYEDLCESKDIDIIYIATPHTFHKEHTLLALRNGKHVMCEKPFALNSEEAEEMIYEAKSRKLFLMEAMWTCVMPGMIKLKQILAEGIIGKVRLVEADFGFQAAYCPDSRLFNRELGGGALLDVGIYPLTLALSLFGYPKEASATANIGKTGIDELSVYSLKFDNGVMADLKACITQTTGCTATIYGSEGTIKLPKEWWLMEKITITNGHIKDFDTSYECSEYYFEIEEASRCIQQGLTESPNIPHEWTLKMMSLMDKLRFDIGLSYPDEAIK